jgi:hypothetical protein
VTRGSRRYLAVVGPIFVVASVVLLATGEVMMGALGVCFSGALLAVPVAARLEAPAPRLEDGALVLEMGRGRRRALVVGGAFFASSSALMLVIGIDGGNVVWVVIGVLGVLTFGGFTVFGVWALRGPSELVVLPEGVRFDHGRRGMLVPWDEIVGIRIFEQSGNRFLTVDVRTPGTYARGVFGRLLARANRGLGGGDVNVPLDHTTVDGRRAVAALGRWAEDPAARAEIGTEAGLRRLEA